MCKELLSVLLCVLSHSFHSFGPLFRIIEGGRALLVDVVPGQFILPAGCRKRDIPLVVPVRD